MNWADQLIAVVDCESTGVDAQSDRIVELAIVVFCRGEIQERHEWLVNPDCAIPLEATSIHGIENRKVQYAPRFHEIADSFLDIAEDCLCAAYHATFDYHIIKAELDRTCLDYHLGDLFDWIDPLVLARHVHPKYKSFKLDYVGAKLGAFNHRPHSALADAQQAGEILFALEDFLPQDSDELLALQRELRLTQESEYLQRQQKRQAL